MRTTIRQAAVATDIFQDSVRFYSFVHRQRALAGDVLPLKISEMATNRHDRAGEIEIEMGLRN